MMQTGNLWYNFTKQTTKGGSKLLTVVLIVSIIIILAVILISVLATTKAYQYEHTVDPMPKETESPEGQAEKKDIHKSV